MTQIILLNGPRGVGKDTAALAMRKYKPEWLSFPVMEQTKLEVAPDRELLAIYETFKDTPMAEFGGGTFREAVIKRSREVGRKEIVAGWLFRMRALIEAYIDQQVIVVPDVRFFEEFAAAVDLVGGRNVYLMRILRPGHDFTGDVGGYIRTDMAVFGNAEVTINNDQDVEFFKLETAVFARGFVARARDKKP